MKNIIIDGRLGSNPEKRTTANGVPYLTFSVGVSVLSNGTYETEWFSLVDYNMTDENRFHKGDYVLVQGRDFRCSYNVSEDKTKIFLNQYATVTQINMLYKKKTEEVEEVSTMTSEASKRFKKTEVSEASAPVAATPAAQPAPVVNAQPAPTPAPATKPAFAMAGTAAQTVEEDLPF